MRRYAIPIVRTYFSSFSCFCLLNHWRGGQPTVAGSPFLQVNIASLMPWRLDNQGNNNWHRLWESNIKSCLQAVRAWLQRLSSSPSSSGALSIPYSTYDSPKAVAMMSIRMNQSPKDQFLHWHQDMERNQEEQARRMKEL